MRKSQLSSRRQSLGALLLSGLTSSLSAFAQAPPPVPARPTSAPDLPTTALARTRFYLARIARLDRPRQSGKPGLGAVIETNPDALSLAAALDRLPPARRGPLHGLPILIKDNIETADQMKTTAGSLALLDAPTPRQDAPLVKRLREAGAVLLGKTNLSEWANFRSSRSTSGWSSRGGQTRNPYDLRRNPSGSSSGSGAAVAADLCWAAIGTETDGSIVSPASINGLVGIKPTVGLVSGAGIIPLAHSQDTAGPMAKTVADAARLLHAIADRPFDLQAALRPQALSGARLGLARQLFGSHPGIAAQTELALAALRSAGATLVEGVTLPDPNTYTEAELLVLLYELKHDLEAYLQARGGPMRTLADLIAFNQRHAAKVMPFFGQEHFERAAKLGGLDSPEYREARAKCLAHAAKGIDDAMDQHRLDALIAPTDGLAWPTDYHLGDHFLQGCSTPAAVAGYPHITVPMGLIRLPGEPALPIGLSFFGRAYSETPLIALAHHFERVAAQQPVLRRQPPPLP